MDKFIRFIVTIVGSIIICILLTIIGMILGITIGIGAALIDMDVKSFLFSAMISIVSFIFIALPYSLIVTYVLYSNLSKYKTKSYGLLAGPFTQGACCWIFNSLTLPYFLISLKYPPKFKELEAPPDNYKMKFIIGWVFGLIFMIALSALMLFLSSFH